MASVSAECRSCGNEHDFTLDLGRDYTDQDLRAQLETVAACDNCGDQDWSVLTIDDA